MKKYDYVIAYKCSREGYFGPCDGTVGISRKKKIKSFDDVEDVRKFIEENDKDITNVGIYNIIFLGRNKH